MKNCVKLVGLAVTVSASAIVFAQDNIPVLVNGNPIHFRGQGPVMNQDRVLVPLRGVLERMGAHVDWDPSSQTVTANRGGTHVQLTIGNRTAAINGQAVTLDVPAQIVDGATMVPLRFIGESLGENVSWDAQDQTVAISTRDYAGLAPHDRRDNDGTGGRPEPMDHDVLRAGTVIQATLDEDVDSNRNRHGDKITADVSDNSLGLPTGTKLEGVVQGIRTRTGSRPGWLSLQFTRLVFPNGSSVPVSGTFVGVGKAGGNWVHNAHFQSGTTFGVRLTNSIRLR